MDAELLKMWMDDMKKYSEAQLFHDASYKGYKDDVRLAAALLLCTCDSNERKAE